MMANHPTTREPRVSTMVEDIVGCKWSLAVLAAVRAGTCRPGAIRRSLAGLSTKVMNERLRKLARYGIVARRSFAEVPPRVEYRMTEFGRRFGELLDGIERLQRSLDACPPVGRRMQATPASGARRRAGQVTTRASGPARRGA